MGAANKSALGDLHAHVARVFKKVLENYEKKLDASEQIDLTKVSDDVMAELMSADITPSPAMLSAITKFLKDNEIMYDTEELDDLSATEERLKARKAKRSKLQELSKLSLVADNT